MNLAQLITVQFDGEKSQFVPVRQKPDLPFAPSLIWDRRAPLPAYYYPLIHRGGRQEEVYLEFINDLWHIIHYSAESKRYHTNTRQVVKDPAAWDLGTWNADHPQHPNNRTNLTRAREPNPPILDSSPPPELSMPEPLEYVETSPVVERLAEALTTAPVFEDVAEPINEPHQPRSAYLPTTLPEQTRVVMAETTQTQATTENLI